jgi:hypothetical protein
MDLSILMERESGGPDKYYMYSLGCSGVDDRVHRRCVRRAKPCHSMHNKDSMISSIVLQSSVALK